MDNFINFNQQQLLMQSTHNKMTTQQSIEISISPDIPIGIRNELLIEKITEWKCQNKDIKRPENGFMIARKRAHNWLKQNNISINMKILSKVVGQVWQELPESTKQFYQQKATIIYHQRLSFRKNNPHIPDNEEIIIKEIKNYNMQQIKQEPELTQNPTNELILPEIGINYNHSQQQYQIVNYNLFQNDLSVEQITFWNNYWNFWNLANPQ